MQVLPMESLVLQLELSAHCWGGGAMALTFVPLLASFLGHLAEHCGNQEAELDVFLV